MTTNSAPIGVFDSGVGGLSVLREIRRELPAEHLLYVADSAYAPYGDRTRSFIEQRSVTIVEFLLSQRAKAVVVACNTATGVAVAALRSRFALPIVAIEPAVKPAAAATTTGVIGVLATSQTLASEKFSKLVDTLGRDVTVLTQACPGLVELVERGEYSSAEARALVERYVRPLVDQHADALVLGCTHYHFLLPVIQEVAGPAVSIFDPALAVARECRRRLEAHELVSRVDAPGTERFWTSGDTEAVGPVLAELWAPTTRIEALPHLFTHVS